MDQPEFENPSMDLPECENPAMDLPEFDETPTKLVINLWKDGYTIGDGGVLLPYPASGLITNESLQEGYVVKSIHFLFISDILL